jgi:flagellar biosynthesis chaperone FliJ
MRPLKTLERLIRYQHTKVEQQRLALQPLKNHIEALEHEIAMIEQNIMDERQTALESIEGSIAFGHYVQTLNVRLEQVRKFLIEARLKLNQELEKLQGLAAQEKVYDKVLQKRLKDFKSLQEKKHYQNLEDIFHSIAREDE